MRFLILILMFLITSCGVKKPLEVPAPPETIRDYPSCECD